MATANPFLATLPVPVQQPRRCPARLRKTETRYGSKADSYVVSTRCKYEPLDNGYCTVHQHCVEMLRWGKSIGYPDLWVNPHLMILLGEGNWEAFASVYEGGKRRTQLMAAIQHYKDGVATWHV